MEDSLVKWVVGAVATGMLSMLAFFANHLFRLILDRLESLGAQVKEENDAVVAEIRNIAATTHDHAQRLALGNQAFQHLHDTVVNVRQEYVRLRQEMEQLHREMDVLHREPGGKP